MVKDENCQPTIEKVWNIIAKSPDKERKRLLVKGQSEIPAGQDSDRSRRCTYNAYLHDTPLFCSCAILRVCYGPSN